MKQIDSISQLTLQPLDNGGGADADPVGKSERGEKASQFKAGKAGEERRERKDNRVLYCFFQIEPVQPQPTSVWVGLNRPFQDKFIYLQNLKSQIKYFKK